jgi:phosphate starvation-inducible PhoH-like protein
LTIIPQKIDPRYKIDLHGPADANLHFVENLFDVEILIRSDAYVIRGEDEEKIEKAAVFFDEMQNIINHKQRLDSRDLQTLKDLLISNQGSPGQATLQLQGGRGVAARNTAQTKLLQSLPDNDIVFFIGPAGTGKTYMAVAVAVEQLLRGQVKKIILTRPAVEAGESLGFLPGDFKEKIAPYLRPLYDALADMLAKDQLRKLMDDETIEVIPLAYMRGRTLNNGFIILDEAQNANLKQMKMFLTRIGVKSKAIITGDVTQIDLLDQTKSGLLQVRQVLTDIEGIEFIYADRSDVVRHKLVRNIIAAYEKQEKEEEN